MPKFYVTALHRNPLFQYGVEAQNAEEAIAKAMADPNNWKRDTIMGVEYDLRARELPKTEQLGVGVVADAQEPEEVVNEDGMVLDRASLARDLFDEYIRVTDLHNGVQQRTGVAWATATPITRRIWRSMAGFVLSRYKPAVELTDSKDIARSAYEAYMRALTHPDPDGWDNGITDTAKRAWDVVVEVVGEQLERKHRTVELTDSSDLARSSYESWQKQFGVNAAQHWDDLSSFKQRRWHMIVETFKELLRNDGYSRLKFDTVSLPIGDIGVDTRVPAGTAITVVPPEEGIWFVRKSPLDGRLVVRGRDAD